MGGGSECFGEKNANSYTSTKKRSRSNEEVKGGASPAQLLRRGDLPSQHGVAVRRRGQRKAEVD